MTDFAASFRDGSPDGYAVGDDASEVGCYTFCMPKFALIMNGQNFLVNWDGQLRRKGFYKSVRVRAEDEDAAELAAVEIIRADQSIQKLVQNFSGNPPMIFLDQIAKLRWYQHLKTPAGATWYDEDDEDTETGALDLEKKV